MEFSCQTADILDIKILSSLLCLPYLRHVYISIKWITLVKCLLHPSDNPGTAGLLVRHGYNCYRIF